MVLQNWSVRIGGVALLVLIVLATAAPWLGTVDPTLFDAASRDLKPGAAGEISDSMARENTCRKSPLASSGAGRNPSRGSLAFGAGSSASVQPRRCRCSTVYGVVRASSKERMKRSPKRPRAQAPGAILTTSDFLTQR